MLARILVFAAWLAALLAAQWSSSMSAGNQLRAEGRFREAREEYLRARAAAQNAAELASSLNNLGAAEDDLGNEAAARRFYEESIAAWKSAGGADGIAGPLSNLALWHRRRGHYKQAEDLYREAMRARPHGSAQYLINLGRLAMLRGRLRESARFYAEAEQVVETAQHRLVLRANVAELRLVEGDLEGAERAALEALDLAAGSPVEVDVRLTLAAVARRRGNVDGAARTLSTAVELSEHFFGTAHVITACVYAEYAGALRRLKRKSEAEEYESRARAILGASPSRHVVSVAELLGR